MVKNTGSKNELSTDRVIAATTRAAMENIGHLCIYFRYRCYLPIQHSQKQKNNHQESQC